MKLLLHKRQRRLGPRMKAVIIIFSLLCLTAIIVNIMIGRAIRYDLPSSSLTSLPVVAEVTSNGEAQLRSGVSTQSQLDAAILQQAAGSPAQIGAARGALSGQEALKATTLPLYPMTKRTVNHGGFWQWLAPKRTEYWRVRSLPSHLPQHLLQELTAMADAAGISRRSLIYRQYALDAGSPSGFAAPPGADAVTRNLTIVASAHKSRPMMIGRVFAMPGVDDGGEAMADNLAVTVVNATGKLPFVSIGWPGEIGVFTGVNHAQLALTLHVLPTDDATLAHVPTQLLARLVLEQCSDVACAVELIKKTKTSGAAIYVLADGKTGSVEVVERTPARVFVRERHRDVIGDLYTGAGIATDPHNNWRSRQGWPLARIKNARLRLRKVRGAVDLMNLLSEVRDQMGNPLPSGHRALISDDSALYRATFDLPKMHLWLQRSSGEVSRIDLMHLLAAAPEIIPEEAGYRAIGVRARKLWQAKKYLQKGRAAKARGELKVAREAAARTLVTIQDYADALRFAGDVAASPQQARRYYETFLALQVDDEIAAKTVAARLSRVLGGR